MSISKFLGGLITKNPPTPSGPYQNSTAPGIWTLTQVANYVKQAIWPTAGNVNPDAFIENLFSTYLYTSTAATQTINNGIDVSGKGGLVWMKRRDSLQGSHWLTDTARGQSAGQLRTDTTNAQSQFGYLSSFNSTGFTDGGQYPSNATIASWTFRKQAKFFDVVTYTGNGAANRYVNHSLASVPGCIILKRTDAASDWAVWHRVNGGSTTRTEFSINATALPAPGFTATHTSTQFALDEVKNLNADSTNVNGATYVAYLFAHDAGGFGLTGADNVISCGSYTGNGSATGTSVTLGYEPQWILIKNISDTFNWNIFDNMRGLTVSGQNDAYLQANTANAEASASWIAPNATGFQLTATSSEVNQNGSTYIYIAIRRGPMKTPTSGTSVFSPNAFNAVANTYQTTNFPIDWQITADRNNVADKRTYSRLTGVSSPGVSSGTYMSTNTTDAQAAGGSLTNGWDNTGFRVPSSYASTPFVGWNFRRAPGFFDQVCYTGTGSATTFSHNLGVAPELMIVKNRSNVENWGVYSAALGNTKRLRLNATDAAVTASAEWNNTSPTASVFTVGTDQEVNFSGNTYINYLFATCPGVSKVGSYTGNGTSQTIDCAFTSGARFVLIKRTDGIGAWVVFDSARGITSGSDPVLELNSTAAEYTPSTFNVDAAASGFVVTGNSNTANGSGATYIFLAIA